MAKKNDAMESDTLFLETLVAAQKKQITELNKKINEQKEEIRKLNDEVRNATAKQTTSSGVYVAPVSNISDEEQVCKLEIKKLLERSMDQELTLEETKKLEIFNKVLNSKKEDEVKKVDEVAKLSEDELLQLMKEASK